MKEWVLALELERRYTKAEILEMYLNVVPWGGNAVGIRAAAEAYFGKDPAALTLAEGLYLASLIPAPNARYQDLEGVRRRMRRVLDEMVREGWITEALAERAWKEPLKPRGWEVRYDEEGNLLEARLVDPEARILRSVDYRLAPHFVLEVRRFLEERFGKEKVYGEGGLRSTPPWTRGCRRPRRRRPGRPGFPRGRTSPSWAWTRRRGRSWPWWAGCAGRTTSTTGRPGP